MKAHLLILVILLIPSVSAYDFPKRDGDHFIFESNWENRFTITQHNDTVAPKHSFSIHNISELTYIQFKRLATDSNHCFNNDSWNITFSLYHDYNLIATERITNARCEPIHIEPNIIYTIDMKVSYDTNQMIDGKYLAIIQMNIINDDIDEPHYFFEVIDFKYQAPPKKPQNLTLLVSLIFIGLLATYITIHYIKSKRR